MSEYNIQMNKYNALNAEYDQLYPATKIENVDGLDTALQNNDPRRWGIGGNAVSIDSLDNAKETGVYKSGGIVCLSIAYSNGEVYQFRYTVSSHGFFEYQARYFLNSVWSPWEYINPRMEIGVEYRTTERFKGKPVYAYALHFDAMPSANSYANRNAPCKNVEAVIDCRAINNTEGTFYPRRNFISATDKPLTIFSAWPNGTDYIYVLCTTDSEGYSGQSATVLLKYTKTTD